MANALSRRSYLLSTLHSEVIAFELLKDQYKNNPLFSQIVKELATTEMSQPFLVHEGFLFRGNQLYIPEGSPLQEQIIRELHRGGLIGHFRRRQDLGYGGCPILLVKNESLLAIC